MPTNSSECWFVARAERSLKSRACYKCNNNKKKLYWRNVKLNFWNRRVVTLVSVSLYRIDCCGHQDSPLCVANWAAACPSGAVLHTSALNWYFYFITFINTNHMKYVAFEVGQDRQLFFSSSHIYNFAWISSLWHQFICCAHDGYSFLINIHS